MRKTFLAALAALLLGGSAHGQFLDVTPHAGYTSFAMGDLNRANGSLYGYPMAGTGEDVNSGIVAGADITTTRLLAVEGLALGLRAEYMQSNLAEFKDDPNANGGIYYTGLAFTDQASLTNVLVGGTLSAPFAGDALSLGLGAWIGGGHGVLNQNLTKDVNGQFGQAGSFAADILVGELEGRLAYRLSSRISLAMSGGWRWADAGQVKGGGTPLYNSWQYWYNSGATKAPVNVDFSGATFQGALNVAF